MTFASNQSNQQLFPSKSSFLIFCSYIALFVSQGLLVTSVQRQQIYGFSSIIIVLATEFVKLTICALVYLLRPQSEGLTGLLEDIKSNRKLLLLYLVPAFLYCLYNNLTFINLSLFDVSTYYCLMQFRIVLTAIIYQILFTRQLNRIQWLSLFILTSGCIVKEFGLYNDLTNNQITSTGNATYQQVSNGTHQVSQRRSHQELSAVFKFIWATALILVQMFCSCFAGVYNEFLLKDSATAKNADVILQNIFMYLDSIICNLAMYIASPTMKGLDKHSNANNLNMPNNGQAPLVTSLINLLTNPMVIILVLNNALSGLVASFFLKSLNSILKTFASALELFAVTLLAWILFNDIVDVHTIIALVLVTVAMIIYSKHPVSVAPPRKDVPGSRNRDGFELLPTTEE